ncbi:Nitrate/nitrite response regulator protein NarL, partial [Haemophilus influenzae]
CARRDLAHFSLKL